MLQSGKEYTNALIMQWILRDMFRKRSLHELLGHDTPKQNNEQQNHEQPLNLEKSLNEHHSKRK